MKRTLLVFVVSCILFSLIQFSTPHILGVDGYYHIAAADEIRLHGFIESQSWWEYSAVSDIDMYFLFHYLLVPFSLLGLVLGAKVYAVVGASLTLTAMYVFLSRNNIRYAYVYPFLTFLSSYIFLYRFSLARAYLLTIPLLVCGYFCAVEKRYWLLAGIMLLFTLSYSLYPLLWFMVMLIVGLEYVQKKSIDYKCVSFVSAGVVAGLLANPYFPRNITMLIKLVWNSVGAPSGVILPSDVLPYALSEFMYVAWVVVLLFIAAIGLVLFHSNTFTKKNPLARYSLHTMVMGIMSIIFFVIALQHKRSLEYWFPFTALFLGCIVNDVIDGSKKLQKWLKVNEKKLLCSIFVVLCIGGTLVTGKFARSLGPNTEQVGLHNVAPCAEYVHAISDGKGIIFSPWDITPALHFYNRDNTYLVGIDPLFLYWYDSSLYDTYKSLMYEGSSFPSVDLKKFDASYVILDKKRSDVAKYFIESGVKPLKPFEGCIVFEV